MTYDPNQHHRRSIRLNSYDYSEAGAYFITICTHERRSLFGRIVDGQMELNAFGEIAREEWTKSAEIRREIVLDRFVVMPNHVHGIVFILEPENNKGGRPSGEGDCQSPLPQDHQPRGPSPRSLASFVVGFKSSVSRRIKTLRGRPGPDVWQRNYFEHVIRDERDLDIVRQYVVNNPLQWDLDRYNPDAGHIGTG